MCVNVKRYIATRQLHVSCLSRDSLPPRAIFLSETIVSYYVYTIRIQKKTIIKIRIDHLVRLFTFINFYPIIVMLLENETIINFFN